MPALVLAVALGLLPGVIRTGAADPSKDYASLAFYVTAHQDDWQLFRGQQAYKDLATPARKVVFIYLTAGDAGQMNAWWQAREQAALAAMRKSLPAAPMTSSNPVFEGHPILRHALANSVGYFFRLPDGNTTGTGFPAHDNQSLSQLRDSGKPVTAVDGSTTYNNWQDVWQTLRAVIEFEAADVDPGFTPVVNASDYDAVDRSDLDCKVHSEGKCNPCDHPDHKAVADALRQFVWEKYDRVWWVSYDIARRRPNLSGLDYEQKKDLFFAYGTSLLGENNPDDTAAERLKDEWDAWGGRNYFRTAPRGSPDVDDPECGAQ